MLSLDLGLDFRAKVLIPYDLFCKISGINALIDGRVAIAFFIYFYGDRQLNTWLLGARSKLRWGNNSD